MNEMLNDVLQQNLHSITYLFIQDGARNTGSEAGIDPEWETSPISTYLGVFGRKPEETQQDHA